MQGKKACTHTDEEISGLAAEISGLSSLGGSWGYSRSQVQHESALQYCHKKSKCILFLFREACLQDTGGR